MPVEKAVIDGGRMVGIRTYADWESLADYKKQARDERGDGGLTLRDLVREGAGEIETAVIEIDRVRLVRSERPLADIKTELKASVDRDAEQRRLAYITPGAGMALTYQEKKDQAVAVLDMGEETANALPNHGVADFPVLAASVGIEADTLFAAATLVFGRYEAFAGLAYSIERERLSAKAAIDAASDVAAARAAYEAIQWTA